MTNKEIARQLGISPAALSIVINHKPGVSDETRAKVLKELDRMGYSHLVKYESVNARNKTFCFVIFKRHGQILDLQPFFLLLLEHIQQRARYFDCKMMMATLDLRQPLEEQITYLNNLNVDGAIIFGTEMINEDIKYFDEFSKPYVIIDNDFSNIPINTVSINNQMGTFQAMEYLYRMGHRQIGYVRGSMRISSFCEREKGYLDAAKQFGVSLETRDIISVLQSEEGSYQEFKQYLASHRLDVTAFVTDDDTIAAGVMRALEENGYHVPEDISIIGYNDRPICTLMKPLLTTISVSKYSFAVEAVDALLGMIRNKENDLRSKKIRIETRLLERESVKSVPIS